MSKQQQDASKNDFNIFVSRSSEESINIFFFGRSYSFVGRSYFGSFIEMIYHFLSKVEVGMRKMEAKIQSKALQVTKRIVSLKPQHPGEFEG